MSTFHALKSLLCAAKVVDTRAVVVSAGFVDATGSVIDTGSCVDSPPMGIVVVWCDAWVVCAVSTWLVVGSGAGVDDGPDRNRHDHLCYTSY